MHWICSKSCILVNTTFRKCGKLFKLLLNFVMSIFKSSFPVIGIWKLMQYPWHATYGRFDHEDWCTHKAAVATWNLDKRSLNVNKPDTVIDSSCCIMCLEFHPENPAWIAGGNFNGKINDTILKIWIVLTLLQYLQGIETLFNRCRLSMYI